jgi:hypothetical protein
MDFGSMFKALDLKHDRPPGNTWALKRAAGRKTTEAERVAEPPALFPQATPAAAEPEEPENGEMDEESPPPSMPDPYLAARNAAIEKVFANEREMRILRESGRKWGRIMYMLKDELPEDWENRDREAFQLVKTFLERKLGTEGEAWHTIEKDGGRFVRIGPGPK